MSIPTESIGSIPRPRYLLDGMADLAAGRIDQHGLDRLVDRALSETIARLEATGSPVRHRRGAGQAELRDLSFAGSRRACPRRRGHSRSPTGTPGSCPGSPADRSGTARTRCPTSPRPRSSANRPVKQAVIAPSALSLLYPTGGIDGYPRERFLADLADESEKDIRQCLDAGAASVQLDFTEGRLSLKLSPSKAASCMTSSR